LGDSVKVSDGKRAEIKVENAALVLRPIVKPARKPSCTPDKLLSGTTRQRSSHRENLPPQNNSLARPNGHLTPLLQFRAA
jgi:hypothetical protein